MSQGQMRILLIDDDEDSFVITRGLLSRVQGAEFDLEWDCLYALPSANASTVLDHHNRQQALSYTYMRCLPCQSILCG